MTQSSQNLKSSRQIKTLHPPNESNKEMLEKRKLISQKYTFKNIRSGSRKSPTKSTPQKEVKHKNVYLKEMKSGHNFVDVKINTRSFHQSPSAAALKASRKNNKNFNSVVGPAAKNHNFPKEEEKSLKIDSLSMQTPRSSVRSKKTPKSSYQRSLRSKHKVKPAVFHRGLKPVLPPSPNKEFGSAKKFKKENRGNREKVSEHQT